MNSEQNHPIIIFGGTFNPIHNGHIIPAIEAAQQINGSKLIYLPCNIPPHKSLPNINNFHRLNMAKLALSELSESSQNIEGLSIELSEFELNLEQTSYTRYTIEHFSRLYPNQPLYFLIGMDSLLDFHKWYKWQEILNYCQLLVMQRPNFLLNKNAIDELILKRTHFVDVTQCDISSSQIRAEDNNISALSLPISVKNYINQHNLY